jgi:hypothetical protein
MLLWIVLYGVFLAYRDGAQIHGCQLLCFFGGIIIADFSPRHAVLVWIPMDRSNLLLRCA